MPATAASLGVADPFDPAQNIDGGVRYLAQLLQQFNGDTQLALAAYDWGPGRVAQHGYSNWPTETINYVSSILSKAGSAVSDVFTPPEVLPPAAPTATGFSVGGLVLLALAGGVLWAFAQNF